MQININEASAAIDNPSMEDHGASRKIIISPNNLIRNEEELKKKQPEFFNYI